MDSPINSSRESISSVDIIIPIYNEEKCIKEFTLRTLDILKRVNFDVNIIFINDGSTDNSLQLIKSACERYKNFFTSASVATSEKKQL